MLIRHSDISPWRSDSSCRFIPSFLNPFPSLHCIASSQVQVSCHLSLDNCSRFPKSLHLSTLILLQHSLHTSAKNISVRCRFDHFTPFDAHPFLNTYLKANHWSHSRVVMGKGTFLNKAYSREGSIVSGSYLLQSYPEAYWPFFPVLSRSFSFLGLAYAAFCQE